MVVWLAAGSVGCAGGRPEAVVPRAAETPEPGGKWRLYETGMASWYGGRWHGRKTANGERFDQNSMTAAHRRLPFNTRVRVTNLRTGQSAVVRINNRGPYIRGRVIDVSRAAAQKIGIHRGGVGRVKLEVPR